MSQQEIGRLVPRYLEPELKGGPPIEGYAPGEDLGDVDDAASHSGLESEPYTITIHVRLEPDIDGLLERVARFNQEIIGLPPRTRADLLSRDRQDFRMGHMREEDEEMAEAYAKGDLDAVADALLDSIYVRLGTLYEMGVNPGPAFDAVHQANMRRVRGSNSKRPVREGVETYDAVKPEDWVGPDNSWIMRAGPEVVELGEIARERGIDAAVLRSVSDVFLHVARVRAGKGQDYNTSVELHDYFPWGHKSYHQMLHLKTLRTKSIIELMDRGKVPNYEGLLDTLYDQLNYTCFYAEALREGRLPITGTHGAADNGHVETT